MYIKRNSKNLRRNYKAVSEALGTILLLLISIVLVSIVAVWLSSIPQEEETPQVDLSASYEYDTDELIIRHQGGEVLYDDETQILIKRNFVNTTRWKPSEGGIAGVWSIGDEWKMPGLNLQATEELEVMVLELTTKTVLLDQVVQEGTLGALVDLAINDEEIEFQYFGALMTATSDVNITAKLYNIGNTTANNIIVRFFVGSQIITYNSKEFLIINSLAPTGTDNPMTISWHWTPGNWGKYTIYIKVYTSQRELSYANNYAQDSVNVEFTELQIQGKDLEITTNDLAFSPTSPTRGMDVTMSVRVHNIGDEPIRKGENVWVRIYDTTYNREIGSYNISSGISALGYHEWTVHWQDVGPGGTMNLSFEVDYAQDVSELDESNNIAYKSIQVMPKILLIDDDGWAGGEFEVRHYLSEALTASGVNYDMHTVVASDPNDPAYTTGPHPLDEYDIIIWTTGYQTTKTLTLQNIQALKDSIDGGAYVWLIGQDILNDIWTLDSAFCQDYLGVSSYTSPAGGTPTVLEGVDGDPITDMLSNMRATNYGSGTNNGDSIVPMISGGSIAEVEGILTNETELGVGKAVATRLVRGAENSKVVFFAWEFSALDDPAERAELTFRVMNWFDWQINLGIDFAIVSEQFSAEATQFMEVIEITAKVRNNGPTRETIDVEFYVTGPDGIEKRIPNYIEKEMQPDNVNPAKVDVNGYGGVNTTSKKWLANSLGQHTFRVMADPYNNFAEVSEENNDITYSTSIGTNVFVQHTVLVVDDNHTEPSTIHFFDDMESGPGSWTHANLAGGVDDWELGAPDPFTAGGGPTSAHSTGNLWGTDLDGFYGNDDGTPDSYALISPSIDLTSATNPKLGFWQWYDFQYDAVNATGVHWDGAIVEITTNGTVWYQVEPTGGHDRMIGDGEGGANNPLEGKSGFVRESDAGWEYALFDVAPFKDSSIKIRFHIGVDEYMGDFGWYIDDVMVFEAQNVVEMMTDSLDMLGYEYDLAVVDSRSDDGPGITKLKKYNTVIWLTGNESTNTLTEGDEQSITAYLEGNYWETKYLEDFVPNLWVIGQDILEDITGGVPNPPMSSFAFRYLKVENYIADYGLPENLEGVYHDAVAHGIDYPIEPWFGDAADAITPSPDATGIIWADKSADLYYGSRYSGRDFNLMFFTFEFAFIDDTFSFIAGVGVGAGGGGTPITLFADGFEGFPDGMKPLGGWNEINTDPISNWYWEYDSGNVKSGAGAVYTPGHFLYISMIEPIPSFDLTSFSNIILSFDWYVQTGAAAGNGLWLDIYYGGAWYLGIAWYTGSGASSRSTTRTNIWIHEDILLDPIITKTSDFKFRFRFDHLGPAGWVDNVFLNATSGGGGGGGGNGSASQVSGGVYHKPEMVFLSMHWFGYEDDRVELKTSKVDIQLSNQNPMVGNSYVIKSEVYNYGGSDTSTIVRFMDGNTIIDTKSLHVAAGGKSSIEVIWTPLFVGTRDLTVDIDPDLDLKFNNGNWFEIFRFNNRAILPKYVYFFFDDMENGSGNWEHDSTIVNINGESKLDYTDGDDVDIISDFDWDKSSSKWIHDYTSSHTLNSAFSIMEPEVKGKVRQPIDAVIQIDSSRHMAGSKWTNLKLAIHAFIDVLESVDRIAINNYGVGGSVNLDWIRMGDTNIDMSAEPGWSGSPIFATGRDVAEYYVDDLNLGYDKYPTGGSPLWREIGESIHQANTTHRAEAMPFVLALADAENTAKGGYDPDINYTGDKTGLLEAPFTVYTILLGEPANTNHDPNYDNNDQDTAPRDEDGWKQGKVRYNSKDHYDMWNIARSSNPAGKHYYIDDSSSLVNLFEFIAEEMKIQSAGSTRAASVGLFDGVQSGTAEESQLTSSRSSSSRHISPFKILLVDDDGGLTTGSPALGLELIWYNALMNFTGASISVTNKSGVPTVGEMNAHDLTIWVAGSFASSTVNMRSYLDGGGMLLLAGPIITSSGWTAANLKTYFGTSSGSITTSKPLTLTGTGGALGPWEETDRYQLIDPGGFSGGSSASTELVVSTADGGKTCLKDGSGAYKMIRKQTSDMMTILWGFDLNQIEGNSTKAVLLGEALAWFSGNRAPNPPVAPYPSHTQELVSLYPIIQWSNTGDLDGDALLYDVYFGTKNPPPLVSFRQYGTYYDTGKLLGNTKYYWKIASSDTWRNTFSSPVWEFTTDIGAGGEGVPPGAAADIGWNNLTSPSFDISGANRATLSFYQRYNLYPALNGAFITVGLNNSGKFEYHYVVPLRPYPSNLKLDATLPTDDTGKTIMWAYNGKSGEGTFEWEYVELNLITEGQRLGVDFTSDDIRIRFCYYRFGGGIGGGWWIDDIKVIVSASEVTTTSSDVWQLINTSGHYSTHSWWNGDPATDSKFKAGIDNSLYTRPIDLTNARSVEFECYLKFNVNQSAGTPPDGFRIEVSDDHGITWKAINKGVRTAHGISGQGTGNDGSVNPYYDDGTVDGLTYPGDDPDGDEWVNTSTLLRLNTDISGWSGRVIMIRIRVVTTNDPTNAHRNSDVPWGGLFIDDVKVKGTSIQEG